MSTIRPMLVGLAALLAFAGAAPAAHAQVPDVQGSAIIVEQNGFGGICGQPCYRVQKDYEVWLETNPGNPLPLAGNNTYIYKLTHLGGAGPIIPGIIKFEMNVPMISLVTAVGHIATSPGIAPAVSAIDAAAVRFQWTTAIPNGGTSKQLYIHSPLLPGTATDNLIGITSQGNLDTPGTCVGPFVEPQEEGEPMPCTHGFWKNRAVGKKGLLKFFPGTDFDPDLLNAAAALSNGIFADGAAVAAALAQQGNVGTQAKAEYQLAALLLNLAAGDLYPNNMKCKLFDGNMISENSCGSNITVAQALAQIFTEYAASNYEFVLSCADDINNGVGLDVEPSS